MGGMRRRKKKKMLHAETRDTQRLMIVNVCARNETQRGKEKKKKVISLEPGKVLDRIRFFGVPARHTHTHTTL